ncbi:MAG: outer membrane lipoprotein-sorting protein [Acidobacteriota bacterium]
MKAKLAVCAVLAVASYTAAETTPDAKAILHRADQARGIGDMYQVQTKITNHKGSDSEVHLFQVLVKGADKSLVHFLDPRDKGRSLLMLQDDMWIFLPNTDRPVRITPLQRLVGNASNGDVARTNYENDYASSLLRTEEVDGHTCYVLELLAVRKGATYQKIHYWVGAEDGLPHKADFFLASGKCYKTATFDRYQQVGGSQVLAKMTIRDLTGSDEWTTMEYSGYAAGNYPDKLFNKTQMGK